MKKLVPLLTFAALFATIGAVHAGPVNAAVPGQKLDSGLGSLPHYSKWADRTGRTVVAASSTSVEGESLDNGLGSLPHYSTWKTTFVGKPVQVAGNGSR